MTASMAAAGLAARWQGHVRRWDRRTRLAHLRQRGHLTVQGAAGGHSSARSLTLSKKVSMSEAILRFMIREPSVASLPVNSQSTT